jgi:hypothetical protein
MAKTTHPHIAQLCENGLDVYRQPFRIAGPATQPKVKERLSDVPNWVIDGFRHGLRISVKIEVR